MFTLSLFFWNNFHFFLTDSKERLHAGCGRCVVRKRFLRCFSNALGPGRSLIPVVHTRQRGSPSPESFSQLLRFTLHESA